MAERTTIDLLTRAVPALREGLARQRSMTPRWDPQPPWHYRTSHWFEPAGRDLSWVVDRAVQWHENFPMPSASVRAWRLLKEVTTPNQYRQLADTGFAVEDSGGRRFVLDLVDASLLLLDDGKLVGYCIDPDRTLCPIDRLISKLVWVRAEPDDFLAEAVDIYRHDQHWLRGRLETEWPERRRIWEHYLTLELLAPLIGEAGLDELITGCAVIERRRCAVVMGSDPVLIIYPDGTLRTRPATSREDTTWAHAWLRHIVASNDEIPYADDPRRQLPWGVSGP